MYNLSEICLLCLNSKNLESVLVLEDNGIAVQEQLTYLFPEITISKSEIPKFICSSCCATVHSFFRFRKMSLENYNRLIQYTQILKGSCDPRGQKYSELQIQLNNIDLLMEREQDVDSKIYVKEEIEGSLQSLEEYDHRTVVDNNVDFKGEFVPDSKDHEFSLKLVKDDSTADIEEGFVLRNSCEEDNKLNVDEANFSADTANLNETCNNTDTNGEELTRKDNKSSICNKVFVQKRSLVDNNVDIKGEFVPDSKDHEFSLKLVKDESTADIEQGVVLRNSCEEDNKLNVDEANFSADTANVNETCNNIDTNGEELTRKDHKCSICNKVFVKKRSLGQHSRKHAGMVNKCSLCNTKFLRQRNLITHIKLHHRDRVLKCHICGKQFRKKGNLEVHLKSHAGIRDHKCSVCNKMFVLKINLFQHMKIHSGIRDHKCSVCNKMFVLKVSLFQHMKKHSGIRDHKCFVCDKIFVRKCYLTKHMKIHSGTRDHKCSVCDKMFVQKCYLTSHMKIHSGTRDHKCSVCNKKFLRKFDLTQHLKIHSGTRDHKCFVCDKMFVQKCYLKKHMKIHSEARDHKCPVCDKKFVLQSDLTLHTKIHDKS